MNIGRRNRLTAFSFISIQLKPNFVIWTYFKRSIRLDKMPADDIKFKLAIATDFHYGMSINRWNQIELCLFIFKMLYTLHKESDLFYFFCMKLCIFIFIFFDILLPYFFFKCLCVCVAKRWRLFKALPYYAILLSGMKGCRSIW